MTAEVLRRLLCGTLVAMFLLAVMSLRRRPLTLSRYALWGLLALFVPALGPFLVILARPGRSSQR